MIELPSLYEHQIDHKDRTRAALARHGRVILNAPTGCGKTRMSKWILGSSANRKKLDNQSGRSLFTVHRRGLVDNAVDSFEEDPALPHGVIMSGRDTAYGSRIQVASIDTLLSWFVDDGEYPSDITFDLIIWDEAHSHHPKFAKFLKYHDARREELKQHPAYVIGLTATPQAKGLADVFVKRGGEFTKSSEAAAMEGLAGDLVRDWKKYAEGRPTVGFFPRRTHAKDAMLQLEAAGLEVAYIDGNTPDEERRSMFRALNNHNIDYICNVQVVERGTDIPRIGCVQLCVAIGSVVRYRQMIGRGSRVHRHGFFEDDPPWTLDITTKDPGEVGARPTIECPKCSAIYRGGKCASCGYEPTPRERRSQGLEFDGRELKEVKRKEKTVSQKTAQELMISALYQAGRSGRTWRQCVGIFKSKCEKQGTPHRVPRRVEVGGHTYEMIQYGSDDANRRVAMLYPFVNGQHGGAYLVKETAYAEAPY